MTEKKVTINVGNDVNPVPLPNTDVEDFWDFIRHLTLDTAKNLALLVALSVIFLSARLLEKLGMDEAEIHPIQQLHFWLTYGVLFWIGIVFFGKLIRRSLK